jgi:membrane-bound metal-dependent hydrolase YbcI (DUF457 family)
VAQAQPFATGILLGAMLPDADLYPAAIAYALGYRDLFYAFHRTFTHSLAGAAFLLILALVLRRRPAAYWACLGAALGVGTHLVLDLAFWFRPVDLFWPLSRLPHSAIPVVNFWQGTAAPVLLGRPDLFPNLIAAGELGAAALYLGALRSLTGDTRLRAWVTASAAVFALTLVTAWILSLSQQRILAQAATIGVFQPVMWWSTWRLRHAIAERLRRRDACGAALENLRHRETSTA